MPDHCDRSLWHIIMRYHCDTSLWDIIVTDHCDRLMRRVPPWSDRALGDCWPRTNIVLLSVTAKLFILHIIISIESGQTWNLSKNLHRRIFRQKILHRQFHLFSTVLVGKTQKMSENGEIYSAGKNFTLPPAVTSLTNLTSAIMLMGLRKKNQ